MSIRYHYKNMQRADGSEVKTPLIPITLRGECFLDTLALLDSGADVSVINESTAKKLGLDMHGDVEMVYGLGSVLGAKFSKMTLLIERRHEKYSFQIPVQIVLGDHEFPVLLGREGFFDKFRIEFYQSEERIILKRNN